MEILRVLTRRIKRTPWLSIRAERFRIVLTESKGHPSPLRGNWHRCIAKRCVRKIAVPSGCPGRSRLPAARRRGADERSQAQPSKRRSPKTAHVHDEVHLRRSCEGGFVSERKRVLTPGAEYTNLRDSSPSVKPGGEHWKVNGSESRQPPRGHAFPANIEFATSPFAGTGCKRKGWHMRCLFQFAVKGTRDDRSLGTRF